jgi:predicted Zn-ribbon and HTH transcriptional regulator
MNSNLKEPCNACPFRKNSAAGYLGGRWTATELHQFVMSEGNFACHKTIEIDNVFTDKNEHCVGSILYMNKNAKRCSHNKERAALQEKFKDADKSNILNLVEFQQHHKDAVVDPLIKIVNNIQDQKHECECNECGWEGTKDELIESDDDDEISVDVCPHCASESIYYH